MDGSLMQGRSSSQKTSHAKSVSLSLTSLFYLVQYIHGWMSQQRKGTRGERTSRTRRRRRRRYKAERERERERERSGERAYTLPLSLSLFFFSLFCPLLFFSGPQPRSSARQRPSQPWPERCLDDSAPSLSLFLLSFFSLSHKERWNSLTDW